MSHIFLHKTPIIANTDIRLHDILLNLTHVCTIEPTSKLECLTFCDAAVLFTV